MAMALADLEVAVDAVGQRVGLDLAGPGAQAHGAAELVDAAQLAQLIDDAVRGGLIELARIRAFEHADVPRKLDACRLHAEANAEVGDFSRERSGSRSACLRCHASRIHPERGCRRNLRAAIRTRRRLLFRRPLLLPR